MFSYLASLFLILPLFKQALIKSHDIPDNVLCRQCGCDVLNPEYILSKISPEALNIYSDTLFNKPEVEIQILPKDFFFEFPVITAAYSACLGVGEWSEDELWFENYRWKPCICSECGSHIGWIFQDTNNKKLNSTDEFYALILPNLIGENCNIL